MSKSIRAAIGSTCSKPGDLEENIRQITVLAEQAYRNDCNLLVTPEMSATGYGVYPTVLALAEQPGRGPTYEALARIASRFNLVVTAGYVEKRESHVHIAHYAVFQDGSFVSQRKHRATPSEHPLEPGVTLVYDGTEDIGHIRPSTEQFHCFWIHGVCCAMVICADAGMHDLSSILKRSGVELMLLPVGAGGQREQRLSVKELQTDAGIRKYRDMLKSSSLPEAGVIDSLRFQRATLAVNMSGFDGIDRYHGGSGSIVSAQGQIVAYIPDQHVIEYQKPSFACAELFFN